MTTTALAQNLDLDVIRGNNIHLIVTWLDEDGDPVNLAGFTPEFAIRVGKRDGEPIVELDENDFILDDPNGTIEFNVTSAITLALGKGSFNYYELRMVNATGDHVTLLLGQIIVHYSPIED